MIPVRRLAFLATLAGLGALAGITAAGCDGTGTPTPTPNDTPAAVASSRPAPAGMSSPTATATRPPSLPPPTASSSPLAPSPTASPDAPATPAPTPSATRRPSPRPAPTAAPTPTGRTPGAFWALVERGIQAAGRVEVAIVGPNAGTLRYQPRASATVIEGVVGSVCVGGRNYDGQAGFAALPGTWTCGKKALSAGFRNIGQPIDAWNATVPTDSGRRESISASGATWTWRYTATSPYVGGRVSAVVTVDRATGRITSARRSDPTGVTRYVFKYGATFPPIAVPL